MREALIFFILLFYFEIKSQIDSTLFFELKAMRDEGQKWRNLSTEVRNSQAVENPDTLDERRLKVGLPSIARYIEIMNSRYFRDLNKKKGQIFQADSKKLVYFFRLTRKNWSIFSGYTNILKYFCI
jgi:hypothetical protein